MDLRLWLASKSSSYLASFQVFSSTDCSVEVRKMPVLVDTNGERLLKLARAVIP